MLNFKKVNGIATNINTIVKISRNFEPSRPNKLKAKCPTKFFSVNLKNTQDFVTFSSSDDFLKEFESAVPFQFNKKNILKSDQYLTSFIPFEKIINKTKAVALSKNFLENFVNFINYGKIEYMNNLQNYCDDSITNKLFDKLYNIIQTKNEEDPNFTYRLYFKTKENNSLVGKEISLKKIPFNINLYNIKNFLLLGIDSNRKMKKNKKFVAVHQDILLNQIVSTKKSDQGTIKCDIYTLRHSQKQVNPNINSLPLILLVQLHFSLIPIKQIYLSLEIDDLLNEKKLTQDYKIESLDFVTECELLRMTFAELNEINFKIKQSTKETTQDEGVETVIQSEEQKNMQLLNSLSIENLEDKFSFNLKIIDVDNFLNGNEILA